MNAPTGAKTRDREERRTDPDQGVDPAPGGARARLARSTQGDRRRGGGTRQRRRRGRHSRFVVVVGQTQRERVLRERRDRVRRRVPVRSFFATTVEERDRDRLVVRRRRWFEGRPEGHDDGFVGPRQITVAEIINGARVVGPRREHPSPILALRESEPFHVVMMIMMMIPILSSVRCPDDRVDRRAVSPTGPEPQPRERVGVVRTAGVDQSSLQRSVGGGWWVVVAVPMKRQFVFLPDGYHLVVGFLGGGTDMGRLQSDVDVPRSPALLLVVATTVIRRATADNIVFACSVNDTLLM